MNIIAVARALAVLCAVVSTTLLAPLYISLWDATRDAAAFIYAIVAGGVLSGVLFYFGFGKTRRPPVIRPPEAFATVTFSWVAASLIGALPFWFYGCGFTDAFFESMSGFTTTGASIFPDVEILPRGLLLWRALTQWLGGMGIIVLSLSIIPALGMGGMELFKAEVPGPVEEKMTPRIQQTGVLLWKLYVAFTALQIALLSWGGMSLFDATCHAFATLSTGGFSTKNASITHYDSAMIEWIVTFFMFVGGTNFSLHYFALRRRDPGAYFRDTEFKFYAGILLVSSFAVSFVLRFGNIYALPDEALRAAAFQVASIMTTTGFVTADYALWPYFPQALLFGLMFVGACSGSTAGGMTPIRVWILFKHLRTVLLQMLSPRTVTHVRVGGEVLDKNLLSSVTTFVTLYFAVYVLGVLAVTATGQDLLTATSAAASALGNVGPALGTTGPAYTFAPQPAAAKWVYSFLMLCGRLELYTVIALFSPYCWRR